MLLFMKRMIGINGVLNVRLGIKVITAVRLDEVARGDKSNGGNVT